jgi:hypothetical protein
LICATECAHHAAAYEAAHVAIDFEVFPSALVELNAHRAVAISRFEVALPEIRRLEDMAICVDDERL